MKKEIAETWVKALRSGKYEQGHGQLKTVNRSNTCYCVMGVLCQISGIGKFKGNSYETIEDISKFSIPNEVSFFAGIDSPYGLVKIGNYYRTLTSLNDDGKTFAELADIIEANYKNL